MCKEIQSMQIKSINILTVLLLVNIILAQFTHILNYRKIIHEQHGKTCPKTDIFRDKRDSTLFFCYAVYRIKQISF